jgi:three-Cys-motif partner protein
MLAFHEDAIILSGLTGTLLKSKILGQYYQFWWNITSGGESRDHRLPTAIIELNSGTGEIFIEETGETILGSAGHALQLKYELDKNNAFKLVLIEETPECYLHLKNVIKRQFPEFPHEKFEDSVEKNRTNVFLLNCSLEKALQEIDKIENLGTAIFFFDPLRMVEWKTIETVARSRIKSYYSMHTEFIIFLFTSDYFLGRKEFAPFPSHMNEGEWTDVERKSIKESDALFGNTDWREKILTNNDIGEREKIFVDLYTKKLQKYFRYVLPLPFNPKEKQIYHLVYCSNFEVGIRATREYYLSLTKKQKFNPDNKRTYSRFLFLHPELQKQISGNNRPSEWKILWALIKQEEGVRDRLCPDLKEIVPDQTRRQQCLDWLRDHHYVELVNIESAWYDAIPKYRLNWSGIYERLRIVPPTPLSPISNEEMMHTIAQKAEQKPAQATLFDGF